MRVCMLVPFLDSVGGMERQAAQLATKMRERGVEAAFITSFYVEDRFKRRHLRASRWDPVDGLSIYRVPVTRISWRLRLLLFGLFASVVLLTKLKGFQIIHAFQLVSTGVAGAVIGWLLRRPVIVKLASGGYVGDLVALRRVFWGHPPISFLGKRFARIVSLTSQMYAELLDAGFPHDRLVIIPNGVDTTSFHPCTYENQEYMRRKLGLPLKKRIAVFVGGLKSKKRPTFLLSAWKSVISNCNGCYLILVGDGPLRSKLEAQCRSLGLADDVIFAGAVDNVEEYLQASDVFVLPSLGEGLSNALLEAMATGLAVITTDTQGNRDVIVHEQNGLLFPPEDRSRLVEQLIAVLTDDVKAERLGQAALATVRDGFSLEAVADSYVRLYSELVGLPENRRSIG